MQNDALFRHVMFAELPVRDQARAVAFYTERLGLELARDAPYREGWRWIELEVPGADTRILLTQAPGAEHAPAEGTATPPALALAAHDVDAAHATLSAAGVEFVSAPSTPPWNPAGRSALLRDSEGNVVLIQS